MKKLFVYKNGSSACVSTFSYVYFLLQFFCTIYSIGCLYRLKVSILAPFRNTALCVEEVSAYIHTICTKRSFTPSVTLPCGVQPRQFSDITNNVCEKVWFHSIKAICLFQSKIIRKTAQRDYKWWLRVCGMRHLGFVLYTKGRLRKHLSDCCRDNKTYTYTHSFL